MGLEARHRDELDLLRHHVGLDEDEDAVRGRSAACWPLQDCEGAADMHPCPHCITGVQLGIHQCLCSRLLLRVEVTLLDAEGPKSTLLFCTHVGKQTPWTLTTAGRLMF